MSLRALLEPAPLSLKSAATHTGAGTGGRAPIDHTKFRGFCAPLQRLSLRALRIFPRSMPNADDAPARNTQMHPFAMKVPHYEKTRNVREDAAPHAGL